MSLIQINKCNNLYPIFIIRHSNMAENPKFNPMEASPSKFSITSEDNPNSPYKNGNRAIGAVILIIMFAVLWIYGWASEVILVTANSPFISFASQSVYGNIFILSAIFTVIGFGLLLTYFSSATATGLFTSFFIVSFTVIVAPILQKFWFNVFITSFNGSSPASTDPQRFYILSLAGQNFTIDYYNLKITLANAISQLALTMGLLGKLTPPQIVLNSVLFNFAWNLNHFLCARLQQISPDRRLFDDYQISSVYLFASSFGIVVSLLIKKPMLTRYFRHSNMSIIFAQIGTFFLFLAFCSTTTFLSLKFSKPASGEYSRSYVWQEAFLGTFFALSASVIATYIFSILLSETRRIGIRESILGTIMGAIMYGPVAGTCTNIGAAIACGIFAGFLSAIFYQKVYPKINEVAVRDSLGLLNIWVVSFLATFVISPIVIRTYYNYTVNLTTFQVSNTDRVGSAILNLNAAGWSLVYVGISVGIGLGSGLIVGLILAAIDRFLGAEFNDQLLFYLDQGLKEPARMMDPFYGQYIGTSMNLVKEDNH